MLSDSFVQNICTYKGSVKQFPDCPLHNPGNASPDTVTHITKQQ